jgi:hypothetical protein
MVFVQKTTTALEKLIGALLKTEFRTLRLGHYILNKDKDFELTEVQH